MPNIQFSVPTELYIALNRRGEEVGLSEHQVANAAMMHGLKTLTNEDILAIRREKAAERSENLRRRHRVRPIVSG